MKVCIGGTFDSLHKGHKALIKKAFEIAGRNGLVFIGITSGEIIKRKDGVKSFDTRKKAIVQFLSEEGLTENVTIKPIFDKYGPSIKGDFDVIVVSPETVNTARKINELREQSNKKPLKIVQIPFLMAKDNLPISSSGIRKKEIDKEGHVLKSN